jgi:hypothetical protein
MKRSPKDLRSSPIFLAVELRKLDHVIECLDAGAEFEQLDLDGNSHWSAPPSSGK